MSTMSLRVTDKTKQKSYVFVEELGRGSFGTCYLAVDQSLGHYYACKVCKDKKFGCEIDIHSKLSHHNIVKFVTSFKFEQSQCMVLELCENGTLEFLLKCRKNLTDPEVRYLVKQTVEGLRYLHSNLIIHRDIKLTNLFLSSSMVVKIGDFGLSIKLACHEEKRVTICGTNNYFAPEMIETKGHGFEVDIWALGCIVYTLLDGREPFAAKTNEETLKNIAKISYFVSSKFSPKASEFVKSIFVADPKKRPTAYNVLEHSYFTSEFSPEQLDRSVFYRKPTFKLAGKVSKAKNCFVLRDKTNQCCFYQDFSKGLKTPITSLGKENVQVHQKEKPIFAMALRPRKVQNQSLHKVFSLEESLADGGSHIAAILLNDLRKVVQRPGSFKWRYQGDPPSFICVTRWVAGMGAVGYHLSDGSLGVHLPSQLKLLRSIDGKSQLFLADGSILQQNEKDLDSSLRRTVKYVDGCLRNLDLSGPEVSNSGPVLVLAKKFFPPSKEASNIVEPAVAFLLTNGSCQVNFTNHEKLLINKNENLVVSWTKEEYCLSSFRNICDSGVSLQFKEKLDVVCYFLAMVQCSATSCLI